MLIKKLEIISIFRYHQQKLIHSEGNRGFLFRVDEFVKFDEFNEKLTAHPRDWKGRKISQIHVPIYDYYW